VQQHVLDEVGNKDLVGNLLLSLCVTRDVLAIAKFLVVSVLKVVILILELCVTTLE